MILWLPKLLGKRCVVTIHGLDWQREKWKNGVASKYIKYGEKTAVKYADEIIVLSKGVREYFWKTYHRETVFIPNGVNKPEIKEVKEIHDKFGLEKDSYILFLGRIVPEKGLRYLIEAYKGCYQFKGKGFERSQGENADYFPGSLFFSGSQKVCGNDNQGAVTGFRPL